MKEGEKLWTTCSLNSRFSSGTRPGRSPRRRYFPSGSGWTKRKSFPGMSSRNWPRPTSLPSSSLKPTAASTRESSTSAWPWRRSPRSAEASAVSYASSALGAFPILLYGSEEQKHKYLPDIASGKKLAAFGLTEAGAGSDASGIQTTAVLDGDHYVLNGTKQWITNGGEAEIYSVIAMTNKGSRHPRGERARRGEGHSRILFRARRRRSSASAPPPPRNSSSRTAGCRRKTSSARKGRVSWRP